MTPWSETHRFTFSILVFARILFCACILWYQRCRCHVRNSTRCWRGRLCRFISLRERNISFVQINLSAYYKFYIVRLDLSPLRGCPTQAFLTVSSFHVLSVPRKQSEGKDNVRQRSQLQWPSQLHVPNLFLYTLFDMQLSLEERGIKFVFRP